MWCKLLRYNGYRNERSGLSHCFTFSCKSNVLSADATTRLFLILNNLILWANQLSYPLTVFLNSSGEFSCSDSKLDAIGGRRGFTHKAVLPVLGLGAVGGGWKLRGGELTGTKLSPGLISLVALTTPSKSTFGVFALLKKIYTRVR